MANEHGLTTSQMAEKVLEMSADEQLNLLKTFYCSKFPESAVKLSHFITIGRENENGEAVRGKSSKTKERQKPVKHKSSVSVMQKKVCHGKRGKTVEYLEYVSDLAEEKNHTMVVALSHGSSKTPVADSQRPTLILNNSEGEPLSSGDSTTLDTQTELENLLYGKSPMKNKPAPKKFIHSTKSEPCESPRKSFVAPGLTYDGSSSSPSRQRDLLAIVKDLSKLQKDIADGKRNIETNISFTQPEQD